MTEYTGYHFTGETLRDGSPIPPVGETLKFDGKVAICRSGLHWSEHAFDALMYAPGKLLHRVSCSEPVESESDKHVSRERTILATIYVEHLCWRFAADQALGVAHLWSMPDVVREYLTSLDPGKKAVARDAAWNAEWDSGRTAAWAAAWAAASTVANVAASAAVTEAATEAAWYSARDEFARRVDEAFAGVEP